MTNHASFIPSRGVLVWQAAFWTLILNAPTEFAKLASFAIWLMLFWAFVFIDVKIGNEVSGKII
ncbi:TPA: hypothetical protein QDB07_003615 [Burkholderia vietnamiensis]|nr:hypothetical protein [Burkholderia vietnamiensis]